MKFIIMSATLPKLDRLLSVDEKTVELLPNGKRYYENPLFRERVRLNFELLDGEKLTYERLVEQIIKTREQFGKKRYLIECIKRKDAENVYKLIQETYGNQVPVALLTGSHHAYHRKKK